MYFNPAGMMRLRGSQVDSALHVIIPSSEFTNGGSTLNPLVGGAALSGRDGKDPGVVAAVPNFYIVHELNDSFKLGLGFNAPFGLKTSYALDWVGRYHAMTSSLKTIKINPSLAMRLNDKVSLGFGINAMYAEARLTNAVDKSTVCLGRAPAATCAGLGLATPGTPATDGSIDLKADDWGYGFNIGVLFEPSQQTRIGASYRSRVIQNTKGSATFSNTADLAALLAGAAPGAFTSQSATAQVSLPETFSVSAFHQLNPKWGVMGDITWTNWNRFAALVVNFGGGHPTNVTPENWEDSMRYSVGLTYATSKKLTLRGGWAFDESPIPNAASRTPRIPGDDRVWASFGAGYQHSDKLHFDFGFAHLFIDDVPISNTEVNTGHVLVGSYEADVNIITGQLTYRF